MLLMCVGTGSWLFIMLLTVRATDSDLESIAVGIDGTDMLTQVGAL